MIETIRDGKPATNFMSFGDSIKLEMFDVEGNTILVLLISKLVNT